MDLDLSIIFVTSSTSEGGRDLPGRDSKEDEKPKFHCAAQKNVTIVKGVTVSEQVGQFLEEVRGLVQSAEEALEKRLRVGIFYNVSETAVFPFRLSRHVVKSMASLGLDLDVTGYPCSEGLVG